MEYEIIRRDFQLLLEELNTMQEVKLKEYGTGRYNLNSTMESIMLCYSDFYRKRIRIEPMLKNYLVPGEVVSSESLRQNLLDMASYCLMIIQVGEEEEWL